MNTSASSMRGGIPQPNADRNICVPTCAGEYPSHVPAPVVDDDDDESKETRKNFAALYLFNYFPIISPLDSMSCMPSAAVLCCQQAPARLVMDLSSEPARVERNNRKHKTMFGAQK